MLAFSPATLLKTDSNTGVFLWNYEHVLWRTYANDCFLKRKIPKFHGTNGDRSTYVKFIQWSLKIKWQLLAKASFENKPPQKSSLPSKSWLVSCLYHLPKPEKRNSISITKTTTATVDSWRLKVRVWYQSNCKISLTKNNCITIRYSRF